MRFVVPGTFAASALSGAALAVRVTPELGIELLQPHASATVATRAMPRPNDCENAKRSSFMGNPPSTATGRCNGRSRSTPTYPRGGSTERDREACPAYILRPVKKRHVRPGCEVRPHGRRAEAHLRSARGSLRREASPVRLNLVHTLEEPCHVAESTI